MNTIRYPFRLLMLGLFLGWAFDLLFWGKAPGVSVLIYAILLLAGLFLALRWHQARALPPNLWLPPLLLLFAAMVVIRANFFLTFLNILAILAILILLSENLVRRSALALRVQDLFIGPVRAFLFSIWHSQRLLKAANQPIKQDWEGRYARFIPGVIKGVLISIPILLILIPLLSSADLIFAEVIKQLLSWNTLIEWGFRSVFMVVIGLFVAGGLAYSVQEEEPRLPSSNDDIDLGEGASPAPKKVGLRLGMIETLIPINLVNLLFLAFMAIQIPYLFGGTLNISKQKFTYAEYARRGFAELVVVAVFIFGIILILHALSRPQRPGPRRAFNLSATLLLALTVVLLISAFKRLALYESVYGFTTLRIYPHVFMIWLGALLMWFAITLWIAPGRLAIGILAAGFGFVLTLNLLNPDAFIVRQNLVHHLEQGHITTSSGGRMVDVCYLLDLSDDAVPALLEALPAMGSVRNTVEKGLRDRYQRMTEDDSWRRWQSWNYSRQRAYKMLEAHFEAE